MNFGKAKKRETRILLILGLLVVLIFLFPFYIAIVQSFKTQLETAYNALALPGAFRLDNYYEAVEKISFSTSLKNSLIVTVTGVLLIVLCSSMSGYAIARNEGGYFKVLDRLFLSSIMVPFQVIMIPAYKLLKSLGLLNHLAGEIVILVGISVAYSSFLYVGFVKSIPMELEDAARIDGCSRFQTFWVIVFPLLKPITATTAALHAMWLWNDFNISLIVLQKDAVRTLTIKQFYFFSEYASDYNMAFAAAMIGMIPILVTFLFLQKYLVSGITSGAVKG